MSPTWAVTALRSIIRTDGIDLVHATENSSLLYASLASRWAKVPVVWMVYDPLTGASFARKVSARLLGQLRPSMIIFGSTTAPDGVPRPRTIPTTTILPGIDLARARSGDGHRARQDLGIPDDVPLIAMFGRVDPYKCQRDLLLALKVVTRSRPDVRAVVCGWEPVSDYTRMLRQLRSDLGLDDVVTITGFVGDKAKDESAAADIVRNWPGVNRSVSPSSRPWPRARRWWRLIRRDHGH